MQEESLWRAARPDKSKMVSKSIMGDRQHSRLALKCGVQLHLLYVSSRVHSLGRQGRVAYAIHLTRIPSYYISLTVQLMRPEGEGGGSKITGLKGVYTFFSGLMVILVVILVL